MTTLLTPAEVIAQLKEGPKPVKQENPLSAYYRLPGLNVGLPTGGAFFKPGDIELDSGGTLAVFPMRAADEYLLKNPDALLSGHAIVKLLESCVPAIKNPLEVSTPDLDVLLLAIRAATYGDYMEISIDCPKCSHNSAFDCHLPSLLQTMKPVEPVNEVRFSNELVAHVRPFNLRNATQVSLVAFTETRRIQNIEDNDSKQAEMRKSFDRLVNIEAATMFDCVTQIITPDAVVTNPEHIAEFMGNISRSWVKKVENKLAEINKLGIDKTVAVKCNRKDCGHEWESSVEFDPSSFFDSGS